MIINDEDDDESMDEEDEEEADLPNESKLTLRYHTG